MPPLYWHPDLPDDQNLVNVVFHELIDASYDRLGLDSSSLTQFVRKECLAISPSSPEIF